MFSEKDSGVGGRFFFNDWGSDVVARTNDFKNQLLFQIVSAAILSRLRIYTGIFWSNGYIHPFLSIFLFRAFFSALLVCVVKRSVSCLSGLV